MTPCETGLDHSSSLSTWSQSTNQYQAKYWPTQPNWATNQIFTWISPFSTLYKYVFRSLLCTSDSSRSLANAALCLYPYTHHILFVEACSVARHFPIWSDWCYSQHFHHQTSHHPPNTTRVIFRNNVISDVVKLMFVVFEPLLKVAIELNYYWVTSTYAWNVHKCEPIFVGVGLLEANIFL